MEPKRRNPLEAAIVLRAEAQWGLLRDDDLTALGLGREAIKYRQRTGRLHRLYPGVSALGHRAISRRAEYLAAVWWCGGDAALAQESACAFHGWIAEDPEHPPPIHVTTTARRKSRPGVVVHETRRLPASHVLTYERLLRVTDDARTLVDRADHLPYRELRLLADQLRALPPRLAAVRAQLPGRSGSHRTHLLVHSEDARATSELERRFTTYTDHHGLRRPDERNVMLAGFEVDCVYHDPPIALELDSRAHHLRRQEILKDKTRDRAYRSAGHLPIRVMWEELDPAGAVAEELHALLG